MEGCALKELLERSMDLEVGGASHDAGEELNLAEEEAEAEEVEQEAAQNMFIPAISMLPKST